MISIQRRLGLALAISLVLAGLALLQTSLWLFEAGLRRNLAIQLEDEAAGLLAAMVRGPDGLQLDPARIHPRYHRPFSGHYFRIRLPQQVWRSRSLWDSSPAWPARNGLAEHLIDGPHGQRLLVFRGEYRRGDTPIGIEVAQDYTPILDSFAQVRLSGLGVVALALLALLLLQRYAIRRALRPLEQTRRQIAQLQAGRRQQLDPDTPEELQPLVAQINRLLAHTEATLQRSRHAVGNLGHALKTPLAVLTSLARREELAAHPALQARLLDSLEQVEQRLALELGRARLAGDTLPGAFFDCDAELPALFDTLAMVHGQTLDLRWHSDDGCHLPWDREDLLELLGNLLDNACKWAKTRVVLGIEATPGGFRLRVDDDGPGIAPALRETARTRGMRLDEGIPGHGLGLAIADDIIRAWHGEWFLEDSPLGGLRVRIELPRP